MSASPERTVQTCPHCETSIDISQREPLSEIICPGCRARILVQCPIAHFRLIEVLGRGGTGVVYRAVDTELGRLIALKLLREEFCANETLMAQLQTEVSITASINHPHVMKLYSTGIHQGRFYIAMELAEKGSLQELMNRVGQIAEVQVLNTAIQIGQGLRAAHQYGLMHRAVKPGNILFTNAETAKIVDFGLANLMEQEEPAQGAVSATSSYDAPEKLHHRPEDFRSDIYSLGSILFHALAGRPVFQTSFASQGVNLRACAPGLSQSTADAVSRMLNNDPDGRYESYDQLLEDLRQAKNQLHLPKVAPAIAPNREVAKNAGRPRRINWVALAICGSIAVLALATILFRDRILGPGRQSTASPLDSGSSSQSGIAAFRDATLKLSAGDGPAAANAFRKCANAGLRQPDLNWATVGEGLAELLSGRQIEARNAFRTLQERSAFSTAPQDGSLATLFVQIGQIGVSDKPIEPSMMRTPEKNNDEAILPLLCGMKDWNDGKMMEAVVFFRQFRASAPTNESAWIGDLKPIAERYIDDFARFELVAKRYHDATDAKEKARLAEELKGFPGRLGEVSQSLAELLRPAATQSKPANAVSAKSPAKEAAASIAQIVPGFLPEPRVEVSSDALLPWTSSDIGAPQIPGGASLSPDGVLTVQGAGRDISGTEDSFHFVYQKIAGDFEIVARIQSIDEPHEHTKAGLMFRIDAQANSANVFFYLKPRHGLNQQYRPNLGAQTLYPKAQLPSGPRWFRLVRRGTNFTCAFSADGQDWTQATANRIESGSSPYMVGLAVTSHTEGNYCTTRFDHIQIYQPPRQ